MPIFWFVATILSQLLRTLLCYNCSLGTPMLGGRWRNHRPPYSTPGRLVKGRRQLVRGRLAFPESAVWPTQSPSHWVRDSPSPPATRAPVSPRLPCLPSPWATTRIEHRPCAQWAGLGQSMLSTGERVQLPDETSRHLARDLITL